jgi:pyridoxamine 5'-phosphate oxidase
MSLLSRIRTVLTMGQGIVKGLPEAFDSDDPFDLFTRWFAEARGCGILLPEAMTLATAGADGRPAARQVLLKGHDERGFVFYTNYESRKCAELEENPNAALLFHWSVLERQVRIEGTVARTSEEESRTYFATRPRGSQLGAWASEQSSQLANRDDLDSRFKEAENRFAGQEVPLPPFWGGLRLEPISFEFWQGRLNRLHDRLLFERREDAWRSRRLYP